MIYEPETILYSLPKELYEEDSPILLTRAVLQKTETRKERTVILGIRSLSDLDIRDMKLELILEPSGQSLESRLQKDLPAEEEVQWEIPVSTDTASFSIKRIGIIFYDSTFWVGRGASFQSLPAPERIPVEEKDGDLFREKTTEQSLYVPAEYGSLWRCSCGEINRKEPCRRCGMDLRILLDAYESSNRKTACPHCQAMIKNGTKFCPYCGEEIVEWKYHAEERQRDEKTFQDRLRELIARAPEQLRRPWWFWLIFLAALIIGTATIISIGNTGSNGGKSADAVVSEAVETPMDYIKRKADAQAAVEFGNGEYEIVADKDKKVFYVNGWPDKAYADLNRARTNEKEGLTQWTLWRETVTTNCETLRKIMDEKGYDDWGCSWSIRSNRNHGSVLLTVFDGTVLYDELEKQK